MSSYLRQNDAAPDPTSGRDVADNFYADLYVLGDVMTVGDRMHINASLYEVAGNMKPIAQVNVDGDANQTMSLVDDLASQLLIDRLRRIDDFRFDFESITTTSFPALKAFL